MISKGMVFWYRFQGKKYVAIIMDKVLGSYYLVLISEEYTGSQNIEEILRLPVYTVAWFSEYDMINEKRLHLITKINVRESFNGFAGGSISTNKVIITNCGQSKTWKHKYRQLITKRIINDMLSVNSYNPTIV